MLNYNHRPNLSETLTELIDLSLQSREAKQTPRVYLGGSRLGVACDRALQFEYIKAPVDPGQEFSGRILRIFEAGHVFESLMVKWLAMAGFDILTEENDGEQYGFSTMDGKIQGHLDGVIVNAPESLGFTFPMLWECKSKGAKYWKLIVKKGVEVAEPVYAAQMSLYQAYMEEQFPGISQNPVLFTAINKDTAEVYFELVEFNGQLAQQKSDRGIRIVEACEAHALLPRISKDPTHFECKLCAWQERCWERDQ
jgi:hypothetical protein